MHATSPLIIFYRLAEPPKVAPMEDGFPYGSFCEVLLLVGSY